MLFPDSTGQAFLAEVHYTSAFLLFAFSRLFSLLDHFTSGSPSQFEKVAFYIAAKASNLISLAERHQKIRTLRFSRIFDSNLLLLADRNPKYEKNANF